MVTVEHDLTPDEAAYYAAWLGTLWPRYERRFARGWDGRGFEWRAAAYPLWMAVSGLWGLLAAFVGIVFASTFVADFGPWRLDLALYVTALVVLLWPAVVGVLAYLALAGELSGYELLPAIMALTGVAFGLLAPSRIVAAGRRRWKRVSARGGEVALPRSVTAPHPLYALVAVAAIAGVLWPWFSSHRHAHDRAYVAALKSDLRNLVTDQETWFAEHQRYASEPPPSRYEPTGSVTLTIVEASDSGWAATARRPELPETICAIHVGKATPPLPGAEEGTPFCAEQR